MTTESYVNYYLDKFWSFERESFTVVLAWEIDFYIEMQVDLRCSFLHNWIIVYQKMSIFPWFCF